MKRLKYIVVKHGAADANHESPEKVEFWDDPEYRKYKEKYGEHFNDKLAVWASKQMDNAHGEKSHSWAVEEVKSVFASLGFVKPEKSTWGDATYAANMAYADYYGGSLKTDADVIRHAHEDISDPDGYPGKVFNRWLADVMGKSIEVPWADFI